ALRGAMRRPFYWKEFFDQCRFILTANFIPLLLTGVGWGVIVSLEAGHFFRAANSEWRLGGFTAMANIREFSPVATGLMLAAICIYKGITAKGGAEGVARAVHSGVVWCFIGIQALEYLYTPTVLALFHTQNVLR